MAREALDARKIFTSRKTRKRVDALAQALLWVIATLAAQQAGMDEDKVYTIIVGGLSLIGGLAGVDIAGTAYEDAAEKTSAPPPGMKLVPLEPLAPEVQLDHG